MRGAVLALAAAAAVGCGGDERPAERAVAGQEVWAAHGCGSCHALAAGGSRSEIGPDLDVSLKGRPQEYVKESIVSPNAALAPDFHAGMMPEDYAQRIEPRELDALVAWLHASTR